MNYLINKAAIGTLLIFLWVAIMAGSTSASSNDDCLMCHEDPDLQSETGHLIGVDPDALNSSVHASLSCTDCHTQSADYDDMPHFTVYRKVQCEKCHTGYFSRFDGSVHEQLIEDGEMNCLSCHRSHQITDAVESEDFGCGQCHESVERIYRTSAHRLARLHGEQIAATCGDCHNAHRVLPASDPESPVNHFRIPYTCGKCHTDKPVITTDYVRLPISLPAYTQSIHGVGWLEEKPTAVCSDCHGAHNLEAASSPTSTIYKENLARTCGKCHEKESHEYLNSVHGRAVAHGITDSPSCTDCHDEHLIFGVKDPRSNVSHGTQKVSQTCAECHEDPEMAVKYGLPPGVIESYEDSYHGWAIKRGGKSVANCVDCHNVHDIRSALDPTSSIHQDNIVLTCGRCHPNSNATFAVSYTHILARDQMMIHDWVRIVYIIMILVILGGMFGHNLIIFAHEIKNQYRENRLKPAIRRMRQTERIQHYALIITFTVLAVTGFALRFPDSWWVEWLTNWGLTEEVRRLTHRITAVAMVVASVYHAVYLIATSRGRKLLKAMIPIKLDISDATENMKYYLGFRKNKPTFGMFDYTQKSEYWALVWGTALMTITGLVLWFPALVTWWLPAWVIRVCEVVHFYEAILAVSAIIIWHFFFMIFLPDEYPMNWTWLTGRMSVEHWEENHLREPEETGSQPEILDGENKEN